MIPFSLADIAQLTAGELILSGHAASERIESVTTDSRTIGERALFIALAGERFDAHDFYCGCGSERCCRRHGEPPDGRELSADYC